MSLVFDHCLLHCGRSSNLGFKSQLFQKNDNFLNMQWYWLFHNKILFQTLTNNAKVLNTIAQGNENKVEGEKKLPVWITGNVKDFDQNDDFVSEDDSAKRILVILSLLTLTLLVTCTILTEKCFDISSISVKKRTLLPKKGNLIIFI